MIMSPKIWKLYFLPNIFFVHSRSLKTDFILVLLPDDYIQLLSKVINDTNSFCGVRKPYYHQAITGDNYTRVSLFREQLLIMNLCCSALLLLIIHLIWAIMLTVHLLYFWIFREKFYQLSVKCLKMPKTDKMCQSCFPSHVTCLNTQAERNRLIYWKMFLRFKWNLFWGKTLLFEHFRI